MRAELLTSECKAVYVINAKLRKDGYLRAGILLCVNSTQQIATFTIADLNIKVLIPEDCLDGGQITKTVNLDLPLLNQDE